MCAGNCAASSVADKSFGDTNTDATRAAFSLNLRRELRFSPEPLATDGARQLQDTAVMDKRKKPDPTPLEIAAACASLRRSWSSRKHYQRSTAMAGETGIPQKPLSKRLLTPPVPSTLVIDTVSGVRLS
jgi:hypothetical protein